MKSLAGSLLTVTLLSVMAISLEIPLDKVSQDFEESSSAADIKQNSDDEETDLEDYEYEDYDDEYDYYDEDYDDEEQDESEYHDDEKEE